MESLPESHPLRTEFRGENSIMIDFIGRLISTYPAERVVEIAQETQTQLDEVISEAQRRIGEPIADHKPSSPERGLHIA
jgi:hypothetical protein